MIEYRCIFPIDRNAAEAVEGFPGDTGWVCDPILVRAGIAARLLILLHQSSIGRQELRLLGEQVLA